MNSTLKAYKTILLTIFFVVSAYQSTFAILTESDKQLNKNIKTFPPVYCSAKSIPWEYWGKRYEFVLSLSADEKTSPKPMSDLSNEFLGYKNKNTKINLVCNKLDPSFDRVISSKVIESFEIDDLSKKIIYLINNAGPQKKVEISLSVARDMKNIEVIESRTTANIFKKYKPARIFNASISVKDTSEDGTVTAYAADSVCYNLK